jgi:hypothetical protein
LTSANATALANIPVEPRARQLQRLAGHLFDRLEEIGLAILLLALAFPAAPPTAAAFVDPGYANAWSLRLGPANVFEVLFAAFAIAWIARSLVAPSRTTSFDRPLAAVVLGLLVLQALVLPWNAGDATYMATDLERLFLIVAGYAIVTRCLRDAAALRTFTVVLAAIIALRATELILVYGVTGKTEFGTVLGQTALLITEDGFLLILPIILAWGAMVDGRLSLWKSIGTVTATVLVLAINLFGLRRGAFLLISSGIIARSLAIGWRRLAMTAGVIFVLAALAVAAGPGRSLVDQARYTAVSSLLQSKDDSSSQRTSEVKNFGRNIDGPEWVTGAGVGVLWRVEVRSPVDNAAFGSGESPGTRAGWHVYGLDWAYKFGLVGVALMLAAAFLLGRRVRRAYLAADATGRSLVYTLAICAVPFLLLALSNLRIALISGVTVGLLSRACDLYPPRPAPEQPVA